MNIATRDVRFRYAAAGEELFAGLSIDFAPKAVTVLTGRSGRGKSTLLYLLGLLLKPTGGTVLYDGVDVSSASDRQRSRWRADHVGFVFQDAALDQTRTVVENVMEVALYARMPRSLAHRRALALLERFDVKLRQDHRPGEVSGGQAQRVALCRALLTTPSLILADEPTGNLDREASSVVLDALSAHAEDGATVIVASHDAEVIDRGGHVVDL